MDEVKQFYRNKLNQHNRAVINRLVEVIKQDKIIIKNVVYRLNPKCKNAINSIIQQIDDVSRIQMDSTYMNIDEYTITLNKKCANFLVNNQLTIDSKTISIFNDDIQSFNGVTFETFIRNILTIQTGGTMDATPDVTKHPNFIGFVPEYEETLQSYTKDGPEPMNEVEEDDVHLKRALYIIIHERFPHWIKQKIQDETESIFNFLFGYFRQLGAYTTDRDFLVPIVDMFIDGSIYKLTHDQFCDLYYEVRHKKFGIPPDDPDPILTSFIKEYEKIMEWEKDIEQPPVQNMMTNLTKVFAGGRRTRRRGRKGTRKQRRAK